MQIVIGIPEEEYRCVQITGCIGNSTCISNAIYNGILLPKGHGDLIDRKDLTPDAGYEDGIFGAVSCQQIVEAEAIIEADKESEDE